MVPSDPSHRSMHELWSVQRVRTRSDQASPIVLWRKIWPQHKCCRAAYHVGWRCRAEVVSGEVQQAWRPAFARGFPRREGVGVQRRAEGILLCCLHEHGTIVSLLRLQQQYACRMASCRCASKASPPLGPPSRRVIVSHARRPRDRRGNPCAEQPRLVFRSAKGTAESTCSSKARPGHARCEARLSAPRPCGGRSDPYHPEAPKLLNPRVYDLSW